MKIVTTIGKETMDIEVSIDREGIKDLIESAQEYQEDEFHQFAQDLQEKFFLMPAAKMMNEKGEQFKEDLKTIWEMRNGGR